MTAEIELKFRIPPARLASVRQAVATSRALIEPLAAVYVDTPGRHLAQAKVALRLRREGAQWVQTLKAQGANPMLRLEHNVPIEGLAKPALDWHRHDGTDAGHALAVVLAGAGNATLLACYETDIGRTRRVLRHSSGTLIELALDEGAIKAGERSLPVSELELELLQGQPQALLAVATRWVVRFGLLLDTRSKSERGHLLAAGECCHEPIGLPTLPPDGHLATRMASLLGPLLASASVLSDDSLEAGQGHRAQLLKALAQLIAVLEAAGDPVVSGLDVRLLPWVQTLLKALNASALVRPLLVSASTQRLWLALLLASQAPA
jgi:inorganic triphosphatase YgiF